MLRLKKRPTGRDSDQPIDLEELTHRVNGYLQAQDLAAAYPLLQQLSALNQDSSQIQKTAGVVAVHLGRTDEARRYFRQALTRSPKDFDARYNTALLDLTDGDTAAARQQFSSLVFEHPSDANLRNDLGAAFLRENRSGRALACFSRALKLDPNLSQARNNALEHCLENGLEITADRLLKRNDGFNGLTPVSRAEIGRWRQILSQTAASTVGTSQQQADSSEGRVTFSRLESAARPRLAFFANHVAFLKDIQEELQSDYDIRSYRGTGPAEMTELLSWSDISWFEWCDDLLIQATRLSSRSQILCRLHSYEAFTDMPDQVNWKQVSHLLFVNESVRQLVASRLPADLKQSVIHNGVDLDRFTIPEGRQPSKKIASVGYINYKKNPSLLLYCFKKLHEYDPEYSLHIAGSHQDSRIALYCDNFLRQNPLPVHFEGWIDDMPTWYADKGMVISTSLFESFHYSVAEGMASGLLPLIHNWFGADFLYPKEYLFSDPDDFLRLVKSLEQRAYMQTAEVNRSFIKQRYDQNEKLNEIRTMLRSMLASQDRALPVEAMV